MQTRRYTHFISNQETSAFSDKVIVRSSPATGRLVAEFADGSTEDAQTAIAAARKAFDEGPWPKLSGVERGNLLFALATRLREEKERLAQIECAEVGEPIKFARGDVEGAIALIDGSPQLPFGGYKASGFGREMGNAGLEEFTQVKTVLFHSGKRIFSI
jgi:betaine-aldehyde dehydrogenase